MADVSTQVAKCHMNAPYQTAVAADRPPPLPTEKPTDKELKFNEDQPRDDHGRWTSGGGDSESTAATLADGIFSRAEKEEKDVTSTLQSVAYPAQLVGLAFALKSKGSLERKISEEARMEGKTEKEMADKIGDSLRYTVEAPQDGYRSTVARVADGLKAKGYEMVKFKNYWGPAADGKDPLYQGVNTNWRTPSGLIMEIQFHTKDSFFVKETLNHKYYEVFRRESATAADKHEAYQAMVHNERSVPVPAEVIGWMLKQFAKFIQRLLSRLQ